MKTKTLYLNVTMVIIEIFIKYLEIQRALNKNEARIYSLEGHNKS